MTARTQTYRQARTLDIVAAAAAAAPFAGAALAIGVLGWLAAAPDPALRGACARTEHVTHAQVIAARGELAAAEHAARFAAGSAYASAKVPPAAGSREAVQAQAAQARAVAARRQLMALYG